MPVPDKTAMTRGALEATPGDLEARSREVPSWLDKDVVDHRTEIDETVALRVERQGN